MFNSDDVTITGARGLESRPCLEPFLPGDGANVGCTEVLITAANTVKTRVMVAEDHPVVRKGLCMLLAGRPDMEVVADCNTGHEAASRYFECNPDVAVIGLDTPIKTGVGTISSIFQKNPSCRLMVMSFSKAEESVRQSFKAGARGYLLSSDPLEDLFSSVKSVASGHTWLSSGLREVLNRTAAEQELTPREMEVLEAMTAGKSNKEIGASLNIAESTVKVHVTHILGKLKVTGRTAAIHVASRRGLVHPGSIAA